MANTRLSRSFFERPTLIVARELLGKVIVHKCRAKLLSGVITEVEAYKGPRDKASHASGGRRTARTEAMYEPGGTVYVFFVYGMHWQFNLSTLAAGTPEAILIRGIFGLNTKQAIPGPGRLCRHLQIDGSLYGEDAVRSSKIWLEDRGFRISPSQIKRGARIGVAYAGEYWAARPWRFWVEPGVVADQL